MGKKGTPAFIKAFLVWLMNLLKISRCMQIMSNFRMYWYVKVLWISLGSYLKIEIFETKEFVVLEVDLDDLLELLSSIWSKLPNWLKKKFYELVYLFFEINKNIFKSFNIWYKIQKICVFNRIVAFICRVNINKKLISIPTQRIIIKIHLKIINSTNLKVISLIFSLFPYFFGAGNY